MIDTARGAADFFFNLGKISKLLVNVKSNYVESNANNVTRVSNLLRIRRALYQFNGFVHSHVRDDAAPDWGLLHVGRNEMGINYKVPSACRSLDG